MKLKGVITAAICFFISVTTFADTENVVAVSDDYNDTYQNNGKTLLIWMNSELGVIGMREAAVRFTKDTGIKVNVEHHPDLTQLFKSPSARTSGPDIILWANDTIGDWARYGFISPIDPNQETMDKFSTVAWQATRWKDKYYGYPLSMEAASLVCNSNIIPNPPKNFEEFIELDKKLSKDGKHALVFNFKEPYFVYPFISAGGGYVFSYVNGTYDTEHTGINTNGAKEGFKFIINYILQGYMPIDTDYDSSMNAFLNGTSGCTITGPWDWKKFGEANIPFTVNPLPDLNGFTSRPFVGVQLVEFSAFSTNRQNAEHFVKDYLLTDRGMFELNGRRVMGVSALLSFESKLRKDKIDGARYIAMEINTENGHIMPNVPEMSNFWTSFRGAISEALSGKVTPEEALDHAASNITEHGIRN